MTRHLSFRTSLSRVLLIVVVVSTSRAFADDPLRASLSTLIEPRLKSKELVAVVVGVIDPDFNQPRVFGFGKTSLDGSATTPDGSTLFEIGSITKVFTSVALSVLVEEGKARLDEPVLSLLPEGTKLASRDGRAITLEDLATHTSTLPRVPSIVFARTLAGKDPYADVTEKDVYDFLEKWTPRKPIGETYDYSNLGAGLLGIALARRAEMSYGDLLDSKILGPLGMKDTRLTLKPNDLKRLAKPYHVGGGASTNWRFDALAGCGGLKSSVDDMLIFARANLDASLSKSAMSKALSMALKPRHSTTNAQTRIGLGWHISESKPPGMPIFWHNGGTGGYRSYLAIEPSSGRAVVVLANTESGVESLGGETLRALRVAKKQRETAKDPKKTGENGD